MCACVCVYHRPEKLTQISLDQKRVGRGNAALLMPVGGERWTSFLANTSLRDVSIPTFDEHRVKDTTPSGRGVGTVGAPPAAAPTIVEIKRQAKAAEAKLDAQRAVMDSVLEEERARVESVRASLNAAEAERQRAAEQARRNADPSRKTQRLIRQQAAAVARKRERAARAAAQVTATREDAIPFGVAFAARRLDEDKLAAVYAFEAAAAARERRREQARARKRGETVIEFGGAGVGLLMTMETAEMRAAKFEKARKLTRAEQRRAEKKKKKKRKKPPTWGTRADGERGSDRLPRLGAQAHDTSSGLGWGWMRRPESWRE